MDVNEHERLPNNTLRHKLMSRNKSFIAVLYFRLTIRYVLAKKCDKKKKLKGTHILSRVAQFETNSAN